jgi:hypothetical protein
MPKKIISHFSVTDIVRKKFKHARSRGILGKDVEGNTYFYGVTIKGEDFITELLNVCSEHLVHEVEKLTMRSLEEAETYIKEYKTKKGLV